MSVYDDIASAVTELNARAEVANSKLKALTAFLTTHQVGLEVEMKLVAQGLNSNTFMRWTRVADGWGLTCDTGLGDIPILSRDRLLRILAAQEVDRFLDCVLIALTTNLKYTANKQNK